MIESFQDLDAAARTVWGEARGEGDEGMAAVVWVVRNRSEKTGLSLRHTCWKPKQFSCWNEDDPNRSKLLAAGYDDPMYLHCLEIVCRVMRRLDDTDPTNGARHYFRDDLVPWPEWAAGHTPSAHIGRHLFFNTIK